MMNDEVYDECEVIEEKDYQPDEGLIKLDDIYPILKQEGLSKGLEIFLFTNEEVKSMLKYYGLDRHFNQVREWYDGYRFGNADVYTRQFFKMRSQGLFGKHHDTDFIQFNGRSNAHR